MTQFAVRLHKSVAYNRLHTRCADSLNTSFAYIMLEERGWIGGLLKSLDAHVEARKRSRVRCVALGVRRHLECEDGGGARAGARVKTTEACA